MAAKLRIQSALLSNIEKPSLSNICKLYLKDLHDLPPIVEIFRYDLEGGMLSKFNQAERHELFQSVCMMNFTLFRFLNCFTNPRELNVNVYEWPMIESDGWMYNPLIPDETVLKELQQAEIEVPNLVLFKPLEHQLMGIDPKLVAVNSDGDLILFRQRANPDVCELLKVSGNEVKVFYTFPEFTLVSFLAVNDADFLFVFADNVKGGLIPTGYLMYDVSVFYPQGDISGIYKDFLLLDGSVVLAPTPPRKFCEVALCMPEDVLKKEMKIQGEMEIRNEEKIHGRCPSEVNIRSEEKIQGEVNIRSEEKIQGEVNIRGEEKIQGEVNIRGEEEIQGEVPIRSEEKIQGEVNIRSEEKIQGKVNIRGKEEIQEAVKIQEKIPRELNILHSILVEIKMWENTLATITDNLQVLAIEQYSYHVRVFEKDGRFVREFQLHDGETEACVAITFNRLTRELVVVSRVERVYFLSTYLPETGKRRHNVRLAHIGKDCQEIHLTSHCRGSIALVTKEHVLYLQ
ncbi:Hypothetical predicted protein [Paramuricea clavata]|uniref:Uncharacterized protein n=1 Tax=Paramuricea clavata TaxID=317549 RepID=A0A6S7IZX8_PARCT|nr:Hypothetical predicted protein [Paramuricea clavata]